MRNPAFKARGRGGSRVVKKRTTYEKSGESVIFTLYHTPIVTVTLNSIILNTGGYRTVTTKRRMNEISKEAGLGFSVYAIRGSWYVHYPYMGEDMELVRSIELPR